MDLKITEERVREAAESCPDVERVMKQLFPEVFENKSRVKVRIAGHSLSMHNPDTQPGHSLSMHNPDTQLGAVRANGPLADQCFWLSENFHWELSRDDVGSLILMPTKKGDPKEVQLLTIPRIRKGS